MIISRLAQIRTERHITTAALAKKSGVSQSTITRIENNMEDPRLLTLVAIARALHVTITDLYTEKNWKIRLLGFVKGLFSISLVD